MLAYHKKQSYWDNFCSNKHMLHFLLVFWTSSLESSSQWRIYLINCTKRIKYTWLCERKSEVVVNLIHECNVPILSFIMQNLFTNSGVCWGVLLSEICINSFICFVGLLLPVVHQSWRFRHKLGLSRHCSHLRLWLEPSKRPAGTSQGSQDWPEETGNPWLKLMNFTPTESGRLLYSWQENYIYAFLFHRWIFIDWSPKEQWRRTSSRGRRRRWFWTILSFREWTPLVALYWTATQ